MDEKKLKGQLEDAFSELSTPVADIPTSEVDDERWLEIEDRYDQPEGTYERMLSRVVESVSDAIMIADRSGTIQFVNPAFETVTGYSATEALGKTADILQRDHHDEAFYQQMWDTAKSGGVWQGELTNRHRDGSQYISEWTIAPIFDAQGEVVQLACVQRSIADQKVTEKTDVELDALVKTLEDRNIQLQTASEVSRAAGTLLDLDELIQQVVDLVCERFDLYYAGIFLADGTGKWAMLMAGTGEPGHQMVTQGHKLEIGGDSMIGWCIANQEARIALDVGEEAIRFANPLLPETRSEMALPLISRGQSIGAMTVQSTEEAAFSSQDISILQTMADQVANAIENARLFEETRQRSEELVTLNLIASAISRSLDLQQMLETALDAILASMDLDSGLISLYDQAADSLYLAAHRELPEQMVSKFQSDGLGGTLCELVFDTGDSLYLNDIREGTPVDVSGLIQLGLLTYAGVPVRYRGKAVGTFCFFNRTIRDLPNEQIALLEAAGQQLGVGVENTQLFQQTRLRAEEQTVLNELGQALTAQLDQQQILDEAYRGSSRLMDTANFSIGLYDPERHEISFAFDVTESAIDQEIETMSADEGITGYVVRNREPLLIPEDLTGRLEELGIGMVGEPAASWIGVPLIAGDRVLGAISAQSYSTPNAWGEHDLELLTAIANHVAIALNNATLFDQVQQAAVKTRERVKELNLLNEIGHKIDEAPQIPEFLQWVAERIPSAMQHPSVCLAAISYEDVVYGFQEAIELPSQMVGGLRIGDELIGKVVVAHTEETDFVNEESALLGDIVRRISGYIENQRHLHEIQALARREQSLRELTNLITASEDLIEGLPDIVGQIRDLVPTNGAALNSYTQGEMEYTSYSISSKGVGGGLPSEQTQMPINGSGLEWVMDNNQPWLGDDLEREQLFFEDEHLLAHGVRSRLILPIQVGDQIVGALDLSSPHPDIFTEEHVSTLLPVVDQMALALERTRLLEETRTALAEVEATYRRFLRGEWDQIIGDDPHRSWGYMQSPAGLTPSNDLWTPEIEQAVSSGKLVTLTGTTEQSTSRTALAVPIRLRGETIGVLDFYDEGEGERFWSEDDIALVEALADQVALALENARLFEQTERRAQRDRLATTLTGKIHAAGDVQSILSTAAEELGRVLGVSRTVIRLAGEPEESPPLDTSIAPLADTASKPGPERD